MRVLAITESYPPHHSGGYQLRCRDVLEGLRARGHQVRVITDRCPRQPCDHHDEIGVVYRVLRRRRVPATVPLQVLDDLRDTRTLDAQVRSFSPHVVYLWQIANLSNAILPYFSTRGIPIVYDEGGAGLIHISKIQRRGVYFYASERDPQWKRSARSLLHSVIRLVSLGLIRPEWSWPQNMRVYYNSAGALQHARAEGVTVDGGVIESAIDVSRFPYRPRNVPGSPLRVITVGRIVPEKATHDSICLLQALARAGLPVELTIVGPAQSADYHAQIVQLVREYELQDRVTILPLREQGELSILYREADVCFFPSRCRTGFSRVPLEAMASGCLVIAYGNESSGELIENGATGFLIAEGDIAAAAELILQLRRNPGPYGSVVRRAREFVEQKHSMPMYLGAIENLLMSSLCASEPDAHTH